MEEAIVQSDDIVTLLGAGMVTDAVFTESQRIAPTVVAADGGAIKALDRAVMPDAVIGDFDSLPAKIRKLIPADRLHHVKEQDSTDFDKAVRSINAPLILAIGFTGRRLDHELAVYNSVVRHVHQPVIVIGEVDLCFHVPIEITLTLPIGTRVSLFPMAKLGCDSVGLRWATGHLTFAPWARVGTSNETVLETITLTPSGPGMLAILPLATLSAVTDALRVEANARG